MIRATYEDAGRPVRETLATATEQIAREARESGGIFEEIDAKMERVEPMTDAETLNMLRLQMASVEERLVALTRANRLANERIAALEALLPTKVVG